MTRLVPIVVLVTDDTFHNLNDYVTTTEGRMLVDDPDVYAALVQLCANGNGWNTTMLLAGSLLAQALELAEQ